MEYDDESDYLLSTLHNLPPVITSPLCRLTHLMFITTPTRKETLSLITIFQVKELRQRDWEVGDSYRLLCAAGAS